MKDFKEFIDENIKEVKAYTVDDVKFYKTKDELLEAIKADEIKRLIKSCLSNAFDFDESLYVNRITSELMKKIDEIIAIYNIKEV